MANVHGVAADASCAVAGSAVGKSSGKSAKGPVDASSGLSDVLSMFLSCTGEDEAEGVDEGSDDRETAFEPEGADEDDEEAVGVRMSMTSRSHWRNPSMMMVMMMLLTVMMPAQPLVLMMPAQPLVLQAQPLL